MNGLAQTLAAAGRAGGPFISGALFSLATHVKPKGEALPFGIFAGVSFIGFVLSMGIRPTKVGETSGENGRDDDDHDDAGREASDDDERTALMR